MDLAVKQVQLAHAITADDLKLKEIAAVKTSKTEEEQELLSSKKDLVGLLQELNSSTIYMDKLSFGFSSDINQLLVQIRDKDSNDIIRQYPTEDFIKRFLYHKKAIGALLDEIG